MSAILILLVGAFALAFLPQMWIKGVIKSHAAERDDIPGTGGEFARHLLDKMNLQGVGVEQTDLGDHYDPEAKVVRLLPQHYGARSLSALVVAAHEVGHAMQDATGYGPLHARTRLAKQAHNIERFGAVVMLAAPIVMLLAKSPHILIFRAVRRRADPVHDDPDARVHATRGVRRQLQACPAGAEIRQLCLGQGHACRATNSARCRLHLRRCCSAEPARCHAVVQASADLRSAGAQFERGNADGDIEPLLRPDR